MDRPGGGRSDQGKENHGNRNVSRRVKSKEETNYEKEINNSVRRCDAGDFSEYGFSGVDRHCSIGGKRKRAIRNPYEQCKYNYVFPFAV
jgi:hypothetical protein